jgi:oxepin-CoA hydrolase / 3-oxo-5,6-dehydrosuberyl-CoA semialdehyde dehydrogenase
MQQIENYALGSWTKGKGEGAKLFHAITGEAFATASSEGLNFSSMTDYARTVGGAKLRKMTFHERGRMLKALAFHLKDKKEKFYELSWATGATRTDSWIDIEGGIGNLFAYSTLRRQFPDLPYYVDGELAKLSREGSFIGHHICVPKQGVAIHINAFNFPVWGMLEKIAVNLLAGVPAIVKPATVTCYLTELVVKEIISSNILPEGSLQLISGSANGILDHVMNQDVVTFTGSAHTGKMLKAHPRLIQESVPFNLEADSLNAMVLGLDVLVDSPEFDLFIKEATREMTVKAGQKCTAVRRIMVPENLITPVADALSKRLASTTIGNPQVDGVRMGSLASMAQVKEVREKRNS